MVPMRYLKNGVSSQFFISSMVTAAIANLCVGGFFLLAFLVNRIKFYGFSFHVDTFSAICLQIDDNKMQIKSRFYSRMCGCVFFYTQPQTILSGCTDDVLKSQRAKRIPFCWFSRLEAMWEGRTRIREQPSVKYYSSSF